MSVMEILLPVFVQVVLTFALLFRMGYLRVATIRSGEVKIRDIALREPNWTPRTLQIANAFHNQLELPMLFYVLTILTLITRQADIVFLALAWIFVALRLAHAWIHVTSNRVRPRAVAFMAGGLVLAVMWLIFMLRVIWVH
ncbi:MAG: MAPEG family protein [Pseudorhodoplanes sp.]|nr:MAG: MAPEG family protein [Pseudorhodoplanes sp.]